MKSHYSASRGNGLEPYSQILFRTQEPYSLCVYSSERVQTASSNGHREGLKLCQLSFCDLAGCEWIIKLLPMQSANTKCKFLRAAFYLLHNGMFPQLTSQIIVSVLLFSRSLSFGLMCCPFPQGQFLNSSLNSSSPCLAGKAVAPPTWPREAGVGPSKLWEASSSFSTLQKERLWWNTNQRGQQVPFCILILSEK